MPAMEVLSGAGTESPGSPLVIVTVHGPPLEAGVESETSNLKPWVPGESTVLKRGDGVVPRSPSMLLVQV
jgi:hypothetical protein